MEDGRWKGWKDGGLEGWKVGRLEGFEGWREDVLWKMEGFESLKEGGLVYGCGNWIC